VYIVSTEIYRIFVSSKYGEIRHLIYQFENRNSMLLATLNLTKYDT